MKDKLLAVTHHGHEVLIGLRCDKNEMEVKFLNQRLKEEFRINGFTVDPFWELQMDTSRSCVNATAVADFFISVLEQRQELIMCFDDVSDQRKS